MNFKHLSEYERGEIYAMIKLACSISSIARHIKRSRTTIYNELKRGRAEQIKNGHCDRQENIGPRCFADDNREKLLNSYR
ncbi:helix-turn-helix domain-containing protein [Peptostreptococcus sp.]|uniref:helix-turn-helix domain-containing protein n=1 Tax=Peptostreptococcus sp. TaxID=1262 RepID=UPI0028D4E73B|nr:helix-turn-helix domain-containing protein [uncultured Peptostreptococcus sp.]